MKFYPMPPTFAEWIRTRLKERYTERDAEEKFEEINSLYEQFVARSPDIGGKKNPMSKEAYSWGVGEDESGDGLYCGFEGVVGAAVIGV